LESSLYLPVKRFLEKLGFEVKGEICGCDLVALRDGEPPAVIIGELKLTFTLELLLQAVTARPPVMRSGSPCAPPAEAAAKRSTGWRSAQHLVWQAATNPCGNWA
jgi:hypothetical protein